MTYSIVDCEQNTPEWLQARAGIATASCFDVVQQEVGPRGGIPIGRQTYLRKLAGEIITGKPAVNYTNAAMERGHEVEPKARAEYAFVTATEPQLVGFVHSKDGICGRRGASPDSLIGDRGMLEIKTAEPHILIGVIEMARKDPTWVPPEHIAQCQGCLWVCERDWIDLMIYCDDMPVYFLKRIKRDETYIAGLEKHVLRFNVDLQQLVLRTKAWVNP